MNLIFYSGGDGAGSGRSLMALGLKGTGLSPFRYRSLLARILGPYHFFEFLTNEPNVVMDPANILLVRIGQRVELAKAANAWVHVDGAFGLWAAAAPCKAHWTSKPHRSSL